MTYHCFSSCTSLLVLFLTPTTSQGFVYCRIAIMYFQYLNITLLQQNGSPLAIEIDIEHETEGFHLNLFAHIRVVTKEFCTGVRVTA